MFAYVKGETCTVFKWHSEVGVLFALRYSLFE